MAEQLVYVPASIRVIRHVRPELACSCCDAIVKAPAPSRPIQRGRAGPGLLAHVLLAKFADHLQLYRQSVIYARDGVNLDRTLLASWVGAASALLRPLAKAIRLLGACTTQVLRPPRKEAIGVDDRSTAPDRRTVCDRS